MKKTVLVRGPALTQSGYGEHTRFVLRALRMRESEFDIHILPTKWGETGWLAIPGEERAWIDQQVNKAAVHLQQKLPYDISVQVTIPNEWQKLAAVNIGVTAGIETNKVAPVWIQQANLMDKIITISEHSKSGFEAVYSGQHPQTGQQVSLTNQTPVEIAHYPVKTFNELPEIDLDLEHDFNYLAIAQWGPRKNTQKLIRWFVEENHDEEVGLVIKTSLKNNSVVDRAFALQQVENSIPDIPDRKCKVYLLHGDMSESEMHALYRHPKVKAMVSLTHGEGFGLPLFEAAYSGLPIVAPGWSGQCDFLYMPFESKSKKKKSNKKKAMFAEIDFTLGPVPDSALWQGVIEKEMVWCYPTEGSFKLRMRQVRKNYDKWLTRAEELQGWVCEEFNSKKKLKSLCDKILQKRVFDAKEYIFVSDFFHNQFTGGAELSLKTLIDSCPGSSLCINSHEVDNKLIDYYKNSKWIIGNIANLSKAYIKEIIDAGIEYSFVEFDYKLCKHRNPKLYQFIEGEECDYSSTEKGKLIEEFILSSKSTFFMSEEQRSVYDRCLPEISNANTKVLSSLFGDYFFEKIDMLNNKYQIKQKNDKWLVLGSNSWVKGTFPSEEWCKKNDLDYDVISGLSYDLLLEKLAESKGLCMMPSGYDTCPRLVIEARLLGCELQTNEHVQHRNEEWFNKSNDEIMKYLRTRRDYFWMHAFNG